MKRIATGILGIVVAASLAHAASNEVTSVNVVGYYKIDIPPAGNFNLGALQLSSLDPADANLAGVFGTDNLTKAPVPGPADKVYIWDTGAQQWNQYFQKPDGQFYDAAAAPWLTPTNVQLEAGAAFMLQSPSAAATTNTITLLGEVVVDADVPTPIVPSFQTVAYPFSSQTALSEMDLLDQAKPAPVPGPADKLYLWDVDTGLYVQYFTKGDGNWYRADQPPWTVPADTTVELGQGILYQANASFTWVETNKYLGNL